jgi:hypothetical protein
MKINKGNKRRLKIEISVSLTIIILYIDAAIIIFRFQKAFPYFLEIDALGGGIISILL